MKSLKERKGDMSHDPGGQVSSRPSTQGLTEAEDSGQIGRNFWPEQSSFGQYHLKSLLRTRQMNLNGDCNIPFLKKPITRIGFERRSEERPAPSPAGERQWEHKTRVRPGFCCWQIVFDTGL